MMVVVLIEKSNKHFGKFMDLLRQNSEIRVNNVRRLVCHSSYYAMILKRVQSLNKHLRSINPQLYLAEPHFDVTSKNEVFSALKRCELIEIESKDEYFYVRYQDEKAKSNTGKSNLRTA